MTDALLKLVQEDPSFHFSRDDETNQTVIEGMGELHLVRSHMHTNVVHGFRPANRRLCDMSDLLISSLRCMRAAVTAAEQGCSAGNEDNRSPSPAMAHVDAHCAHDAAAASLLMRAAPASVAPLLCFTGMLRAQDIIVDRLRREFNVTCQVGAPQVNYRESISRLADIHYTHKKQSGGAGQYADIYVKFEPGEPASGFTFRSEIKGGSVCPALTSCHASYPGQRHHSLGPVL